MSRHFRPWTIDQTQLLLAAVVDYVPADHLAQFVVALAREHLDLTEIVASYKSGLGQPPFDPRMMTALLLYAYCTGLYSSRRIAKACAERVDFMMIVAHDAPDFRTIADFRKRHLPPLGRLFLQVLKLAEKAGLAKLGHVALDGTKIKANASKHKAMSYERMKTRETALRAEVDRWLEAAEAADAQEDKLHGASRRGDEMPGWIADKQKRLAKIREAREALEAEAAAAAAVLANTLYQLGEYRIGHDVERARTRQRHVVDRGDRAGPLGHNQHAIGKEDGLGDRVGDQEHGFSGFALDPHQFDIHPLARHRVERAERLVHQHDLGIVHQRAADRGALLHPTGQLPGQLLLEAFEPGKLQQRHGAQQIFLTRQPLHVDRQHDVGQDIAPRQQQRVLKHDPDIAVRRRHPLALDQNLAGGRRQQS